MDLPSRNFLGCISVAVFYLEGVGNIRARAIPQQVLRTGEGQELQQVMSPRSGTESTDF